MNPWFSDDGRLRAGWRFLLALVVWYVANFISIGVAEGLARGRMTLLEAVFRPLTLVLLLAGFALLLMVADRVDEGLLPALGLGRFPGWLRQAALGMAIGAGLICIAVAWIAIVGSAQMSVKLTGRAFELGLAEIFILATGAMAEEVMFRGYPFRCLLEATPPPIAVLVMSVLFAAVHGGNPHVSKLAMVNTFAIAVLFCVAYLRTRALWLPWGIHFAWNAALGLVFGLPVSGLTDFAVIVKTQAQGPRWVTGGSYGIEGSVVGTVIILLGFIPVILCTQSRSREQLAALVQSGGPEGAGVPDQPAQRRIEM